MKIKVSFEIDVPVDATSEQIGEWISFSLHERGVINRSNPLSSYALEARSFSVEWDELNTRHKSPASPGRP